MSTRTALGPSSVTVPSGTGYLSFPAGDGELSTGPADAHQRSEAAYPIVHAFASVVKKPEGVERKLTIAKGQPILFLPIGESKPDENDGTTVSPDVALSDPKNKVLASRRYRGANKYLAIVGKNKYDEKLLLSAGYVAFAAEPTAISFDEGKDYSVMTAISCAIEYESDVLATCPANISAPVHCPAGTAIMAGIFYDSINDTTAPHDPTPGSSYCIRACAGFPSQLHGLCATGQFVPRRCATAIVPFVALPMADGDLTVIPPVRAAIIARPFPSSVM